MNIKFTDNSQEVLAAMQAAAIRALEKCGLTAEGYAKKLCPVDTGRLRNSITFDFADSGNAVEIGTNVEYAPHVELGTRTKKAQPFLKPAVADHADVYRRIFTKE